MRHDKGFSLTELLVVISIIGILAGIIMVGGGSVRRDARDRRRKADVEQIVGLLQVRAAQQKLTDPSLWRPVSYGENNIVNDPVLGGTWDASNIDGDTDGQYFVDFLVDEGYASQIPLDPLFAGAADTHFYQYRYYAPSVLPVGNCQPPFIVVVAHLEGQGNAETSCFSATAPATYYIVTGT